MKPTATLTAICIAAMASLATAQTPTPVVPQVPGSVSNPRETTMSPQNPTLNEVDRTFVKNAAVGGMFEVQSSEIATTASQNQAVKAFAQKMIQDHGTANQKLKQLAAQKYVPVPTTLDAQHAKMLQNLSGKQGDAFDKAYGRAQLKAHKEAVELFTKASQTLTDPDLKQFATTTLPTLKQHLQMAKELPGADSAGKMGKAGKKGKKKNRNANQASQGQSE